MRSEGVIKFIFSAGMLSNLIQVCKVFNGNLILIKECSSIAKGASAEIYDKPDDVERELYQKICLRQ